jgi:hypothetical protein
LLELKSLQQEQINLLMKQVKHKEDEKKVKKAQEFLGIIRNNIEIQKYKIDEIQNLISLFFVLFSQLYFFFFLICKEKCLQTQKEEDEKKRLKAENEEKLKQFDKEFQRERKEEKKAQFKKYNEQKS